MIDGGARSVAPALAQTLLRGWAEALDRGCVAVLVCDAPQDIEAVRAQSRAFSIMLGERSGRATVFQSRSASSGWLAVAMCSDRPVGVDVETARPDWVNDSLLDLALHPRERGCIPPDSKERFFSVWTRKEAVLKAMGTGLALPASAVEVGWSGGWKGVSIAGATAHVTDLPVRAPGVRLAVAAIGSRAPVRLWTLRGDSVRGMGAEPAHPHDAKRYRVDRFESFSAGGGRGIARFGQWNASLVENLIRRLRVSRGLTKKWS